MTASRLEVPVSPTDAQRQWIDGMRRLCDFLEAHPEIPVTFPESVIANVNQYGSEDRSPAKDRLAAIARLPGRWTKDSDGESFQIKRKFGPHKLLVFANHNEVCERVTRTETVTREVPDPDKLAEVPTVTVTEEVEHVEWVCPTSLLALDELDAATGEGRR